MIIDDGSYFPLSNTNLSGNNGYYTSDPDATPNNSNKEQDYLKGENIEYVPRDKNPANVPELRPIEDSWTEIKRLVYADNWQAENLRQLRNRIDYCMKKINQNCVHRLGASTFTRVDRVRRYGMINE